MFSISLNLKQGIDRLSINKWLMGLLVAIPIAGIGSYVAYNQLVTVPQQKAQSKNQTVLVMRGRSEDLGLGRQYSALYKKSST